MILTGDEISKLVIEGQIKISPFSDKQITTNSYDLRLGEKVLRYLDPIIDVKKEPNFRVDSIPEEGLLLKPGEFVLAESHEKVGSDFFVPLIHAKSGTARAGLFVHVTADLIDIGSYGRINFQLFATLPIRIFPHMLIGQVTFWKPQGKIELYKGKYQGSDGPVPSQIYKDFSQLSKIKKY